MKYWGDTIGLLVMQQNFPLMSVNTCCCVEDELKTKHMWQAGNEDRGQGANHSLPGKMVHAVKDDALAAVLAQLQRSFVHLCRVSGVSLSPSSLGRKPPEEKSVYKLCCM